MPDSPLNMLVSNWWMLAIRGCFAILFGLFALLWPIATMQLLVLFFGTYALVDGIIAILAALAGKTEEGSWWALVLEGILGIGAGIVTLTWPGITVLLLITLIGAWAIVTGIVEIAAAFFLRKKMESEWTLVLCGIVSVLFGLLIFRSPLVGTIALLRMIALFRFIFGILVITFAFKLRSLGAHQQPGPGHLAH